MRAVVYASPGKVRVDDAPTPHLSTASPWESGKHSAILRMLATGICGSDLHTLHSSDAVPGMILGHELVGVVVDVGQDVDTIAIGDVCTAPFNVACGHCDNCRAGLTSHCLVTNPHRPGATYGMGTAMGSWPGLQAEYAAIPYADFNLYRFADPEQASERLLDVAMLTDVLPTGYHAARQAQIKPGTSVYVAGAGPVGLASAAAARFLGAEPILVGDTNAHRLAQVRHGGFESLDITTGPIDELIAARTGAPHVDAGIDCAGPTQPPDPAASALNDVITTIRPGGTLSMVGVYPATSPLHPLWVGGLWSKSLTLRGGPTPVRRYQDTLARAVLNEDLTIASILGATTIPLENAAEAYQQFQNGASYKAVLVP